MTFDQFNIPSGPVFGVHFKVHRSIGVLDALGEPTFIGETTRVGRDQNGLALWTLRIGGQPTEGVWVVIGRVFKPAQ